MPHAETRPLAANVALSTVMDLTVIDLFFFFFFAGQHTICASDCSREQRQSIGGLGPPRCPELSSVSVRRSIRCQPLGFCQTAALLFLLGFASDGFDRSRGAFMDTRATAVALYRTLWQSSLAGLLNDFFFFGLHIYQLTLPRFQR